MFNFTIIIILFFFSKLESKEFCEINEFDNLTHKIIECRRGEIVFGTFSFFSENFNHDYEYLEVYEIKIIKKLKKKIVNFVISYCDKNKSIKIKEIINPFKKKKLKYKNEVIVSCVFK